MCDQCDFKTIYKQSIDLHLINHKNLKTFKCEIVNTINFY